MNDFDLNREKAVNSLLFVVSNLEKADTHKTYKILYFADQKHLAKYGRPIFGDSYKKMQYGPVPSFVKNVVDEEIKGLEEVVAKYHGFCIKQIQELNTDFLSETDLECLTESIEENKNLSFKVLTNKSHDEAYMKSSWSINPIDIAKSGSADKDMIAYINQQLINERIELR